MPRKPTGTIYESNGRIYAQVTVGHNKRRSFVLPDGIDCDTAEKRATMLAEFATKLRNAGRENMVVELVDIAAQHKGTKLDELRGDCRRAWVLTYSHRHWLPKTRCVL